MLIDPPLLFRRFVITCLFPLFCSPVLRAAYTWSNVAIGGGGYVTGIVYHPAEQNLRYTRTDVGGAYRWDQASARWVALNDDIGGLNNEFMTLGVLSVALDPSDPGYVYLACGQYLASWAPAARLLRSTDRGVTWAQITLPFKLAGNGEGRGSGERLAVDPHNPARLLLGTNDAGLWSSTNRGASWTRLTAFTPAATTFVLPDRFNAGVIYVGVPDNAGPSLWRSTDDGVTWAAVPDQPTGLMALQGALDASGTLYLTYANAQGPNGATAGAVRKLANAATTVAAASWTTINPPSGQGGYCGLSLDAQRPGVVLVSTLDRWWPRDEIYYSENGGSSWKGMLDGATLDHTAGPWASTLTSHWITDIEIDPFDSARATFVTGFGLFATANLTVASGKPTWAFANAGLEETVPTGLVSPASGPPLVSTIGDFDGFRHDNLNTPPAARHNPRRGTNRSLDGAGAAPAVLVRLHDDGSISRDGGSTWTVFPSEPPTVENGEGRIAVSANGARLLWCPANSTPYWSADDGLTWTAALGAPNGSGGSLLPAADRVNALDFYVYDPAARRVLRSTDGGVNFVSISPQLPTGTNAIRAVPGRAGEFWVSSDGNGLRRLTAGGATVTQLTDASAAYAFGFGMAAAGADHPALFLWGTVGGVTGIYRSDNIGATWTRLNDNAHQFGRIDVMTGDPRVFGRVYLGTSGRGIVVGEPDEGTGPGLQPSQSLYEDSLATGWNNWSWATVNLAATAPVRRGACSVAVTAGGYQAFYLNHDATATAGYTALGFWIHGGGSGGQSLQLNALRSGVAQTAVNLTAPTAGVWTRVVVPLSDLGVAGVSDFTGFWIQNRTGSALPAFYLDDLTLVGEADASAWSAAAAATVTLGGLSAVYDGAAKAATATSIPTGLPVTLTYNGNAAAPTAAGTYTVVGTINAASNQGSATGTLTIAKATATVTLGSLSAVYDGGAKAATATTSPAGLAVTFTYNGASTPPANAGAYAVVGTINDANYAGSAAGTLTIAKAAATVTLGSLSAVYDGGAKVATATTSPAGLAVTFTYDGASTPPTNAGAYAVVGTINDTNYAGSAAGTLTIAKATATVTLGSLSAVYDGGAKAATATTSPAGLAVTFTYNEASTPPANAGAYAVVGTINDTNHAGSATGTLTIAKATATVTLGSLSAVYDGGAKAATATTSPAGLAVTFTYNGASTPPANAGAYAVVGTINDANYAGSATGTLTIAKATATVALGSLSAVYDGGAKAATATTSPAGLAVTFTYNGASTPPANAGAYAVVGNINDANYSGSAAGTLTIAKATATVALGSLSAVYDGGAKAATATTSPAGLAVTFTYDGAASPPSTAGGYAVVGTIDDANHSGSASGTLTIAKASANVTLGGLSAVYDGGAKAVTATTSPAGLAVTFTYDGAASAPSAVGTYSVAGTIDDANYEGSATGTLAIRMSMAAFRAQYFTPPELADPGISGPLADPDNDGLANLLEYAFALNPRTPDAEESPILGKSNGRLTLTFARRLDVADLAYVVAVSDDLQTWASGPAETEEVGAVPLDPVREQVLVRDLTTLDATFRRFLRLQVTLLP